MRRNIIATLIATLSVNANSQQVFEDLRGHKIFTKSFLNKWLSETWNLEKDSLRNIRLQIDKMLLSQKISTTKTKLYSESRQAYSEWSRDRQNADKYVKASLLIVATSLVDFSKECQDTTRDIAEDLMKSGWLSNSYEQSRAWWLISAIGGNGSRIQNVGFRFLDRDKNDTLVRLKLSEWCNSIKGFENKRIAVSTPLLTAKPEFPDNYYFYGLAFHLELFTWNKESAEKAREGYKRFLAIAPKQHRLWHLAKSSLTWVEAEIRKHSR